MQTLFQCLIWSFSANIFKSNFLLALSLSCFLRLQVQRCRYTHNHKKMQLFLQRIEPLPEVTWPDCRWTIGVLWYQEAAATFNSTALLKQRHIPNWSIQQRKTSHSIANTNMDCKTLASLPLRFYLNHQNRLLNK